MSEPRRGYLDRLPFGMSLPLDRVVDSDLFPFTGEIRTKPLERPIIPEPGRKGAGGEHCFACADPAAGTIWRNERWHVRSGGPDPSGLPIVAVLMPNAHHDLADLPPDLAAELGPMIQRVARAITLPEVGRVHVNRWGDGSEHFHIWLLPRPLGMWQMRGAMLAIWDDILPPLPREEWEANRRTVAVALAAVDGEATV